MEPSVAPSLSGLLSASDTSPWSRRQSYSCFPDTENWSVLTQLASAGGKVLQLMLIGMLTVLIITVGSHLMKMEGLEVNVASFTLRLRSFKIAASLCLTKEKNSSTQAASADLHVRFSQLWFVRTCCQCNAASAVAMATSRRRRP